MQQQITHAKCVLAPRRQKNLCREKNLGNFTTFRQRLGLLLNMSTALSSWNLIIMLLRLNIDCCKSSMHCILNLSYLAMHFCRKL